MIIKQKKNKNFTILSNEIFMNNNISARAKGVYAYIMTLPNDWKIYKSEIYNHFSEGRTAIDTAFKELEDVGYISKKRIQTKNGTFNGWEFTCLESIGNDRLAEKPKSDRPKSVNPQLLSTNVLQSTNNTNINTNSNCPEIPDSSKEVVENNAPNIIDPEKIIKHFDNIDINTPPIEYKKPKPSQSTKVDNTFTLTNLAIKRGYITKDYFDILLAFIKESTMDINYNNLKGICAKLTEVSNSLGKMYRDDFNNGSRGYTTFALYHYIRYRKWYLTLDIFKYFPEWVRLWDNAVRYGYANNGKYYTYKLDDMSSKEKIETVKWSEWCNLMLEKQRSK